MKSTNNNFTWSDFLKAIWYFYEGERGKFVFWTSTVFVIFFYQLIPPILIGWIIDFFNSYQKGESLNPFYTYVAVLGISYGIVSIIRLTSKNQTTSLQYEAAYNMKVKGFEKLLDFSLQWHDKENTGNKVQRIQNGLIGFRNLQRLLNQTGFETITAISGIIIIFIFLNPLFVIFMIIYLVVYTSINFAFYNKSLQLQNDFNKAQEKASGSYFEGINNLLTIKTLGAKDSFKKNIDTNEFISKEFTKKIISLDSKKWKIFQIFNALSMIVYLLMVGNGVLGGIISIGSIFLYYTYLIKLSDAAGNSTDLYEQSIESKSAISRMMPIYWEENAFQNGAFNFPHNWESIEIKNGSFNYSKTDDKDNESIFEIKRLDLHIHKYEKIGIAGISGGGKSTLAKLLLGLYQLESGVFKIGDTNFYDIKHEEITKHIAIVLQESEMFNLTLKENITLMRNVKPELLTHSIKIAQLEDLIAKVPEGLETIIGEKGYRLSGGERQRIGIARAICKDPEIFVFDEATSALDNKTEYLIHKALEKELEKKTLLIIAHRLSTLKDVDRVCIFDQGKIIEEGKFNDLINNNKSKFHELAQIQNKDDK